MAFETTKTCNNVIAFAPRGPAACLWVVSDHFGAMPALHPANESYCPAGRDGAQTGDQVLDFLYGVARAGR